MTKDTRNPWLYVPTLYFAEGLPYVLVNTVSVIMYKKMGLSNEFIGLTSILYLPWFLKMAWSPFVDIYRTRRAWIIGAQAILCGLLALLALSVPTPLFIGASLALFILMALASATNDIATDGFYMLALDTSQQAFFLGIRSAAYRLSLVFGSGLLVVLAGIIESRTGNIPLSWSAVLAAAGLVCFALALFHRQYLPKPAADAAGAAAGSRGSGFIEAFKTYFMQPRIAPVIGFILLYRLGEAMLIKMAAPFLLDRIDAGGLGLSTETVGIVYGTVGIICLSAGGILGGWLIARLGLKRIIWPMAIILNVPHLLYVYMAMARPPLAAVYLMVGVEQFCYGLGFTAMAVFIMYNARDPYKTSHFAISTGFMALGMMLPGMISGMVQQAVGYVNFFIIVVAMALPGMALVPFIPLDDTGAAESQQPHA
ncbi:MAG: MFS transporter [Deltaproteobacteria bacterium]|nr:MFS transporter [Deltaproteobacteria bacterium]